MAVDEALWSALKPDDAPIVCLHDFDAESVTLGHSQSPDDLVGTGLEHLPTAKRPTGGGAIHHHDGMVSFSLIAFDAGGAKRPGPIACRMGTFLVALWRRLGVEARVVSESEAATHGAPMCSDRQCAGDVLACGSGLKIAGIGQRHRRGRLLVQAAVLLDRVGSRAPLRTAAPHRDSLQRAVGEVFGAELKQMPLPAMNVDHIIPVTSGGAPSRIGPKWSSCR
jgi:lipoate-protein ligase A